jgi:hypothetical protein
VDPVHKQSISTESGKGPGAWLVVGYISCLLCGLPGMCIGSIIIHAKRKDKTHLFNEQSRKHGKMILYTGSIVLVLFILFFMNWFFFEKILFGKRQD